MPDARFFRSRLMPLLILMLVAVLIPILTGCQSGGIITNNEYSVLVDKEAAWSAEAARRSTAYADAADAGKLSFDQTKASLRFSANALTLEAGHWARIQRAKNGKAQDVPAATLPAVPSATAPGTTP